MAPCWPGSAHPSGCELGPLAWQEAPAKDDEKQLTPASPPRRSAPWHPLHKSWSERNAVWWSVGWLFEEVLESLFEPLTEPPPEPPPDPPHPITQTRQVAIRTVFIMSLILHAIYRSCSSTLFIVRITSGTFYNSAHFNVYCKMNLQIFMQSRQATIPFFCVFASNC